MQWGAGDDIGSYYRVGWETGRQEMVLKKAMVLNMIEVEAGEGSVVFVYLGWCRPPAHQRNG